MDLAYQIGGDGFDSLKLVDVEELLADEPLADIDSAECVVQFNLK